MVSLKFSRKFSILLCKFFKASNIWLTSAYLGAKNCSGPSHWLCQESPQDIWFWIHSDNGSRHQSSWHYRRISWTCGKFHILHSQFVRWEVPILWMWILVLTILWLIDHSTIITAWRHHAFPTQRGWVKRMGICSTKSSPRKDFASHLIRWTITICLMKTCKLLKRKQIYSESDSIEFP